MTTKLPHLKLLLVALLWCASTAVRAQAPIENMQGNERAPEPVWARHFGSSDDDGAYAVLTLEDGTIALAGDIITPAGNRQMCLLKLGRHGDLIYEKHYAGSGVSSARAIRTTNDGGFVLAGSTRGVGGNGTDLYLVKTDFDGDVEWSRISQDRGGDFSEDILHARGGGFVSAGKNALDLKGGYNIVKMNKPGTIVWTRNFPGEQANAIVEISNGRLAALGVTETIPNEARPKPPKDIPQYPWVDPAQTDDEPVCSNEAAWLFSEVDWKGSVLFQRTYWKSKYDVGNALLQTDDGGFLLVGSAGGCPEDPSLYDCWIVRADSTGDTLWTQTYGGILEDQAYSVIAEPDGFVIAGSTRSWGTGERDALLFKIDKRGTIVWSTAAGGPGDEICYEVQSTRDGYILSGTTTSYGEGDTDMYLVKLQTLLGRSSR
ncbi:MAG: hypothetical protein IPG71_03550 [bacterium]|nr:hypothetical protein [bacterium]